LCDHRKLQLNELSELRDQAYENYVIYKERTKKLHDSKIKNRIFNVGDQVLLFNSRLKIFSGKLKTRWSGLFTITCIFPYGTIELSQPDGLNFKVNGHRVKHYFGGDIPSNIAPDLHTIYPSMIEVSRVWFIVLRALSIYGDVYPEWCLEFFSKMYFDRDVDRTKLMTKKCIWFRLCGVEKGLTLPEFVVLLGLYEEVELSHRLLAIHFTRLEVDDKLFNHEAFWQKISAPTNINPGTSLIREPLMRIVNKLLVGSLFHRAGSKERCQKRDMWLMSALEESRGINLAWVIFEHRCKHAPGLKENSLICGGYVTKITASLGYLNEDEVAKCSNPIESKTWAAKMFENELDEGTNTLLQTKHITPQPSQTGRQRQELRGLDLSWGDWNSSMNEIERCVSLDPCELGLANESEGNCQLGLGAQSHGVLGGMLRNCSGGVRVYRKAVWKG
nr:reverse transcriptase domain-containing protein [Tanacetum cinerariifolium]